MVRIRVMVFNATFNNISTILWWSVLLVEKTGEPGWNYRSAVRDLCPHIIYICIVSSNTGSLINNKIYEQRCYLKPCLQVQHHICNEGKTKTISLFFIILILRNQNKKREYIGVMKTQISNYVRTTRFWNNLYQVRSK